MHVLSNLLTDLSERGRGKKTCLTHSSTFQETCRIFIFQNAFASDDDHPTEERTDSEPNCITLFPERSRHRYTPWHQPRSCLVTLTFNLASSLNSQFNFNKCYTFLKKTHRFITKSNYVRNRASSTIFHNNP